MDRNVAEAIRQQSEDLREELKELEQWEDTVKSKEAARAQRKTAQAVAETPAVVPPIRGTVPSLKEAVRQQQAAAGVSGGAASVSADPIQQAKDRGNAFFQAGKVQEAVAAYTVGIDLDPASATTHVLYANRAMCYLKLGQWTAAEKDATTCVQMNTGYAKAYYRRAMARKNLHKLREARADLEAVLALAPKDVSAQQEMVEVTKALQAERAAATASAPATNAPKKRIVIEEVDSEEDDEAADGAAAAPPPPLPTTSKISAEEEQLRQSRIDEDLKKLAAARAQQESKTRMDAQREAQVQAQRQRRNQRVEIIEEEEEEEKTQAEVKSAPAAVPKPAPATPQHVDPTPAPAPAPPAPAAAPTPSPPRPRVALSKENLTAPKSFTEFERRFRELQQTPELRNYYVSLLQPATLSKLFGSNMTADILLGILESVKTFDGPTAFQFAKGLSQVNRVENTTMFFNATEKAVVQEVMDLLKASSGGPEKDIQAIQRKLKPF